MKTFKLDERKNPTGFAFATPSVAETERREAESLARYHDATSNFEKRTNDTPDSPISVQSPTAPLLPLLLGSDGDDSQPLFRLECARVVATFLQPGSRKELNLDSAVRDTAIRNVMLSSHPDVVSFPLFYPFHSPVERVSSYQFMKLFMTCYRLPLCHDF